MDKVQGLAPHHSKSTAGNAEHEHANDRFCLAFCSATGSAVAVVASMTIQALKLPPLNPDGAELDKYTEPPPRSLFRPPIQTISFNG